MGIIQCIEMRIDPSQNKIVNLLKEIKRFNEEYSWDLGAEPVRFLGRRYGYPGEGDDVAT